MRAWIRPLLAGIVGYAVIVGLTSLGFSVWLEGKPLHSSGPIVMLQGAIVALISGLAGGATARLLGGSLRALFSALLLLAIDTTYVLFFFEGDSPWWTSAIGSAVLIAATIAGARFTPLFRSRGP